jgi:hypothetical protein
MKNYLSLSATALLAGSLLAADSSPKDEIAAAARKLSEQANYSWKATVVVPESSRFRPGPTEGKTEKDGFTQLTMSFGDNTTKAVLKGDKAAVTDPDGDWRSLTELNNAEGPGRFLGMMLRSFKTPAAQATELIGGTIELEKHGDSYTGELTEQTAKAMLTLRPRAGGDNAPTVSNAKGSAKYWLTDGMLSKYESHVTGKVSFNGTDRDVDRTTTVEIKDIGTTKVEVSEEVKKKLE